MEGDKLRVPAVAVSPLHPRPTLVGIAAVSHLRHKIRVPSNSRVTGKGEASTLLALAEPLRTHRPKQGLETPLSSAVKISWLRTTSSCLKPKENGGSPTPQGNLTVKSQIHATASPALAHQSMYGRRQLTRKKVGPMSV